MQPSKATLQVVEERTLGAFVLVAMGTLPLSPELYKVCGREMDAIRGLTRRIRLIHVKRF